MTTLIDYALMAGASYISNRPEINRIPVPDVWLENIEGRSLNNPSGFEATYFAGVNNEIVISFAGTDFSHPVSDFVFGNIPLASGVSINGANQLVDAVEYYLKVKNDPANAGKTITITGHSLGGALAALVGVFFGETAFTFDQVPAYATATAGPANLLRNALFARNPNRTDLAPLDNYIAATTDTYAARAANITNINVQGEVAGLIPAPRIGNCVDIAQQNNMPIPLLAQSDLHSMALLTTFLQSNQTAAPNTGLNDATFKLPDLLKMIFDKNLFAHDTDKPDANFLEHLVKHEAGVQGSLTADAMVTRFTADLWKIAQDGGLSMSDWGLDGGNHNVSQALIAFAMEKYYSEQAGGTGAGTPLFQGVSGGIQFDTSAVVGNGGSITSAKGYTEYFRQYLTQVAPDLGAGAVQFTAAEQQLINAALPQLRDWYVQAGATGMTATDSNNLGAFMLGGNGVDTLTGGTAADLLVGNAGNDILDGGDNNDILTGGAGTDTYIYNSANGGDGSDTITDSDGAGQIKFDSTVLTGGTRQKDSSDPYVSADGKYTFDWSGGDLVINLSTGSGQAITVKGFSNNDLGIHLDESEDPNDPPGQPGQPGQPGGNGGPGYNRNASTMRRIDPLVLDLNGNGQIDAIGSTASTTYFDFNGDGISERSGWVSAQDGMLALDSNGNGAIDGLDELFGTSQVDGFTELAGHDSNTDGVIDAQDSVFAHLKVWQDENQDGISQAAELKTLDELGITAINLDNTPADIPAADNIVMATGSFVQNGTTQLAADINLAVNFTLTDANPIRPLGQTPALDSDVYQLPWLRGYGNVASLQIAFQNDPALRQSAQDLIAQGATGILQNFDKFMARWTGLDAARQAKGVTRTNLTTVDKVWMLETLTGQNVEKAAIEASSFDQNQRPIAGGAMVWNTGYIDTQWHDFAQREAISFAIQATAKDWIKGAYYSLNNDRFIVTDAALLQDSLTQSLSTIGNRQDAVFAANDACHDQAERRAA
ncbi:MAG: hypothetical protein PHV02_16320 [Rhodocyclaceae bacterium]|nr:hypothetical protein [Rhodocyclaceae bacterium]